MTVFLLLSIVVCFSVAVGEATGYGTTLNILEIIEGRCHEYVQCTPPINSNIYCDENASFNCTSLIKDFTKDVAYREPCSLASDAFDAFVANAAQNLPTDTHILWSGTKVIAHQYALITGRKTLEDTLIGFLMNDVSFCGSRQSPGFNFDKCPYCSNDLRSASSIFWSKASSTFARSAKGKVEVVLSATNFGRPSFRNGSVFRSIEVPLLTNDAVSELTAILVTDIGEKSTKRERCGNGSLLELQTIIEDKNIAFYCEENPDRIRAIQCSTKPEAAECLALFNSELTHCQQTRKNYIDSRLYGGFLPSCNDDGSYVVSQCDTGGFCFCVDEFGEVIEETKMQVRGVEADCSQYIPEKEIKSTCTPSGDNSGNTVVVVVCVIITLVAVALIVAAVAFLILRRNRQDCTNGYSGMNSKSRSWWKMRKIKNEEEEGEERV